MTSIEHNIGNNRQKIEVTGLMETDPEYQLIVEANNIAVEIDGEIGNYYIIIFLLHIYTFQNFIKQNELLLNLSWNLKKKLF